MRVPPVVAQRVHELQGEFRVVLLEGRGQRREGVRQFGVKLRQPGHSVRPDEMGCRLIQKVKAPCRESRLDRVAVGVLGQPFERVLPHGFEHEQALVVRGQQLLGHERVQDVERGASDGLGRRHGGASGEDGHVRERAALLAREQVIAPVDRRAQRALALRSIAGSADQHRERTIEPRGKLGRRE